MTRQQVMERRVALRSEVATLGRPGPDGSVPPDVEARMAAIEREAEELDTEDRRLDLQDRLDRTVPGQPVGGDAPAREVRAFEGVLSPVPQGFDGTLLRDQHGNSVPLLAPEHRMTSFVPATESRAAELGIGGFFRALYRGAQTETERRIMGEASIGTGGALVPTPLAAEVIDVMRARTAAIRAGARTVPMTSQTLRFARVIDTPAMRWRAENSPIAVDEFAFDAVTLTAHTAAVIVKIPRELLEDAPNLNDVVRAGLGQAGALALDGAVLFGTGTNDEPRGVANDPNVTRISMGPNGGAVTNYNPLFDTALALDEANAGDISAIIYSPRTARAFAGLVDTAGNPLAIPARFASVPRLVTTAVPNDRTRGSATNASVAILGDFSKLVIGLRTTLQVSVLGERYADYGQVAFLAWMRADCAVVQPTALAVIEGIIPA